MHLAEGTTVDTALAVTFVPAIYNSADSLIPGMQWSHYMSWWLYHPPMYRVCPFSMLVTLFLTSPGALLLLVFW